MASHSFVDFNLYILSIMMISGLVMGRFHELACRELKIFSMRIRFSRNIGRQTHTVIVFLLVLLPMFYFAILGLANSYDEGWGRSRYPVGYVNGTYGRGAIRGVLFLDRNNNGVHDPGEQGVARVTVNLDRGFSVETDANGEFTFDSVASGAHVVRFNTANVPLPWEPRDEKPLDVTVHTRESAVVEIPLVNLHPN